MHKEELLIETDEPSLPKRETITLSGIEKIRFDGKEPIPFVLYPSGRIIPSPLIELTDPKGKTFFVDLRYPLAISLTHTPQEEGVPLPAQPRQK